jgi:D-serine deaminase-like pyridoxal phosphate-dependent protein
MVEPGTAASRLDTPAVVVYLDVLEANIAEMTRLASDAGVRLRPHTKIHECPDIAKLQVAAGACGIEVGTIERAMCMAAAGIPDILIAHPFYGAQRFRGLQRLLATPGLKVTVMVDMIEQAQEISRLGEAAGTRIPTLLKINTGGDRFGVRPGEPALEMARQLAKLPGITFAGIYAHESGAKPTQESQERLAVDVATSLAELARLLTRSGLHVPHVSVGASPTLRATCALLRRGDFPEITEIHPGHCLLPDMWHVRARVSRRDECAAAVLCTVMSTTEPGYVVVDAGYKTFGADPLIQYRDQPAAFWNGMPSYGSVQGRPDLWVGRLSAEAACVHYTGSDGGGSRLRIGDRLEIVPNNTTLAISLQSEIYGVRKEAVERVFAVGGRLSRTAAQ